MKRGIKKIRAGFTLVELLTVIAVVAILLAVLVPTFNKVSDVAHTARQKAQFHGLGIALEAVYTDLGDYPPSAWDRPLGGTAYGAYAPSQRLAEAVIGLDGFGVHRNTEWKVSGMDSGGGYLYLPSSGTFNQADRFGPYMELENANAVKMSSIYSTSFTPLQDDYVLVDMYKVVKNQATGKMGGMPILYYRANRDQTGHNYKAASTWMNTYDVNDALGGNIGIASLAVPFTTTVSVHPMKTDAADGEHPWFYDSIQNPNFPGDPTTTIGRRPYRADSFILHSAGPDGLYGNSDDIFNFDQDH